MKTKFKKTAVFMSATLALMLFASSVYAEVFKLEYGDQFFQGENTLLLKKKIKESRPGLDLRSAQLDKVIIVAKSAKGKAKASLQVGYEMSEPMTITGFMDDFNNPAPYTFDRIRFKNKTGNSMGKWQVALKGRKIIVKKVIVITKQGWAPPTLLDTIHLGHSFTQDRTQVNMSGVQKLIIKATQGKAVIQSVTVRFANGMTKQLYGLSGQVMAGQQLSADLHGKAVKGVKIVAKAKYGQAVIKLLAKTQGLY